MRKSCHSKKHQWKQKAVGGRRVREAGRGSREEEEKVRRMKIPSRSRLPVHQCLSP